MAWRRRARVLLRERQPEVRHDVRGLRPAGPGVARGTAAAAAMRLDARLAHPANLLQRQQWLRAGQHALGNRAVQGLLRAHRLQARLVVNAPGDAYEREADRVAAAVSGVPEAAVQRQESAPEEEVAQARPAAGAVPEVTPQVEASIGSLRGGGRPLPAPLRDFYEPRFGADFGGVRLHTGEQAAGTAQAVRARAFTVGRDIVFGAGQYAPETAAGRSLLAHELTHVVQQGAAGGPGAAGRTDERLARAPDDGPPRGPEPAPPTPKEQEALAKALMAALHGKKPEEKDQGSEAVKKTIEAFLETPAGKKIKQRAIGFALGSKGLPFTLLVGSAALAAMVASNTSIPSVPDIPLSKNMSLQFGFQGTFQRPTGFTIGIKIALGGESQRVEKPAPPTAKLPAWSPGQKIPADLLRKWILGLSHQEYELAGPDEEEDRRKFYLQLKEDPETVPDARLLAEALGRQILAKSAQGEKRVDFDLQHEDLWREVYKRFDRVKGFRAGLLARLRYILDAVVAELPESARGLEQVTFACAGRLIPLGVIGQVAKAR